MSTKPIKRGKSKRPARGAAVSRASRSDAQDATMRRLLPPSSLYARDAMERVRILKEGLPAQLLVVVAREMAISREKLYSTIGVARATVDRKVRDQKRLNLDESERTLGIMDLVGQVDQIVRESGSLEGFDAARWVAAWLDRPHAALGGARPGTLMDTAEGRSIVSDLVARMQSGAYA